MAKRHTVSVTSRRSVSPLGGLRERNTAALIGLGAARAGQTRIHRSVTALTLR
jgi:hypothetical protein